MGDRMALRVPNAIDLHVQEENVVGLRCAARPRGQANAQGDEPRRGLEPSTYRDHADRAEHDRNEVVAQVESGATSAMTAAKRCSGSPACACAYSLASSIDSNGPTIESGGPWNGPHSTT
jgi:hypothetical protein